MNQLSKMMLAAVASVAIAAPAFAWTFGASGTSTANFNSTSKTATTGATALSSGGVTSSASSLKLSSSHTDGTKTLSLSYTLDWDGNLDETIALSGSSTVGAWTASGDISYNRDRPGCYQGDNGTAVTTNAATAGCQGQTGEDTTAVTLTDGTMTIKLGDASHLSGQNVSSSGAADGAITMNSSGMDASVGAAVDGFHGVSLGYKISDTMSATVAYQTSSDAGDMMGAGAFQDGEKTHGTSGFGLGFSGTFGPATIGFTQASATTANADGTAANDLLSTSSSTMGLGVKIDLGDIDPFISYGSFTSDGASSKNGLATSGSEFGLTYALGSDSVVIYIGSTEETVTTAGTAGKPLSKSAMELGYNTMVGPASLKVGYGSQTHAQTDGATDGYSMTDIEVALSYSF